MNHEGPSKHYSSPADQLSRKVAVRKFYFRDAGIINYNVIVVHYLTI